MGKVREPEKVLLFTAITYKEDIPRIQALKALSHHFNQVLLESIVYHFDDFTLYYKKEMGENLFKCLYLFDYFMHPLHLNLIKRYTNWLERLIAQQHNGFPNRIVNIDPGFLNNNKVVLASTKDFTHRIYTGNGIFQEITLRYHKKQFAANPWTFADYQSQAVIDFLTEARNIYYNRGGPFKPASEY